MAIYTVGGGITAIRGTIGGLTFSANGSGPNIRPLPTVTTKHSFDATSQRIDFAGLPLEWRNLTPTQRSDWSTFSHLPEEVRYNSLSQPYYLTGYQSFISHNLRLLNAGMTLQLDAPVNPIPLPIAAYTPTYQAAGGSFDAYITFIAGSFSSNCAHISGTAVGSLGRTVVSQTQHILRTEYPVDPLTTSLDFTIAHALIFGLPQAGWKLFLSVRILSVEGRISTALDQDIDYTP